MTGTMLPGSAGWQDKAPSNVTKIRTVLTSGFVTIGTELSGGNIITSTVPLVCSERQEE